MASWVLFIITFKCHGAFVRFEFHHWKEEKIGWTSRAVTASNTDGDDDGDDNDDDDDNDDNDGGNGDGGATKKVILTSILTFQRKCVPNK